MSVKNKQSLLNYPSSLVYPNIAQETITSSLWTINNQSPWISHECPMNIPWISYEYPMNIQWYAKKTHQHLSEHRRKKTRRVQCFFSPASSMEQWPRDHLFAPWKNGDHTGSQWLMDRYMVCIYIYILYIHTINYIYRCSLCLETNLSLGSPAPVHDNHIHSTWYSK